MKHKRVQDPFITLTDHQTLFIHNNHSILQTPQTKPIKPNTNEPHPLSPPLTRPHHPTTTRTTPSQPTTRRVESSPTRPREFCPSRLRTLYRAPSCSIVFASDLHLTIQNSSTGYFDPLVFIFSILVEFIECEMEPMDIVGKAKEDASLPKATMTKIIKEMLPPDVRVARDTQDLLIECCVEFINLVSSESNEVCGREDRRTIAPEHVLKALEVLGFGNYIEEVYAAYEQHKLETVDTIKGGRGTNGAEMTEEEALAEQQRMFAEARARMNGVATAPKPAEAESSLNSQILEPF